MDRQKARRIAKWVGAFLAGVLLLVLITFGAALMLLQTEYGRNQVAGLIGDLTRDTSYQVEIRGFGGAPPRRMEFERVEISDNHGVWLVLSSVHVRWDVFEAFRGLYRFPLISAEEAHWHRLPEGERAEPKPVYDEPFSIPELPSVVVNELSLQRVVIDREVFGRAQVLSAQGRLDSEGEMTRAWLTVAGTEGDSVQIRIEHDPRTDQLTVDATVSEEPGGIVGGLLGIADEGPIRAAVHGQGPLGDWRGEYSLSVGGLGASRGRMAMAYGERLSIDVAGRANVEEGRLPSEAASLLGTEAEFDIGITRSGDTLRLERAIVHAGPVDLSVNGAIVTEAQAIDLQINVTFDAIPQAVTRLLEERGIRLEEPGPVRGSIKGPLRQPEIQADIGARVLSIGGADLTAPRIALEGRLLRAERTGFEGEVNVNARRLVLPDLPPLSPVKGAIKLSTPDFDTFSISHLALSSPGLDITGAGTLHREGWRTEGTIDVRVTDPDKLLGFGDGALPGRVVVQAGFKGGLAPADVTVALRGTASRLEAWPGTIRSLSGEQVSFSGEVAFGGSVLEARDVVLNGQAVELSGSGQADLERDRFSIVALGRVKDLNVLPGGTQGALDIQADAAGRFGDFETKGTARGRGVRIGGEPLSDPVATFSLSGLPSRLKGQFDFDAAFRGQPVEASGGVLMEDGRLALRGMRAKAPGLTISADIGADPAAGTVSGYARAAADDLSFVAVLTGTDLAGSGTVDLTFAPDKGRQGMSLELSAASLDLGRVSAEKVTASGRFHDIFGTPGGAGKVRLNGARIDELQVSRLDATLSGDLRSLEFGAQADGRIEHPFDIAVVGAVSLDGEVRTVRLESLVGTYAALPVVLRQPATLLASEDLLRLSEVVLSVDKGLLRAQGELAKGQVRTRAAIRSMPVEILSLIIPHPATGTMEGDLELSGPLEKPVLGFDFSSRLSLAADPDLPPLTSEISGRTVFENGMLSTSVSATGVGPEPLRIRASFPAVFSLDPFVLEIPEDGGLQGSLSGMTELQRVTPLLNLDGHTLSGRVALDLTLAGVVTDPLLQGSITLADGRYENFGLAMIADRMNATIRARGREMVIESFTATDGERGRISAEGTLRVDPERAFPFETAISLRSFRALRRPDLSTAASGSVRFAGDLRSARAEGKLTLDPLHLAIPDRTAPAIARLEVKEVNVDPAQLKIERARGQAYPIGLGLTLDFPARFFVRGRGLDAEFSGQLNVAGTAQAPVINGNMSVVRGDFTFLDRRFELVESSIIFTGATPPMPILDVNAEWTRQEITVFVRLSGSASEPEITLDSDPALPSDEILSRVIFGRSVTELTPIQALRLANALRVLTTGNGGGFDILATLRTTFGLDELEIRDEAGGTALDVGRYLHENVYLRLRSATSPSSPMSTTGRPRSSTPCSARAACSARARKWPSGSWTRWTSNASGASPSRPRTAR
jgi:translocation and assembly module TamB